MICVCGNGALEIELGKTSLELVNDIFSVLNVLFRYLSIVDLMCKDMGYEL